MNSFTRSFALFIILFFVGQTLFSQTITPELEKELIEEELLTFEAFVIKAKEHGATHVRITDNIPHAFWQFDTEGDPYPAWYIHQPSLLKIFPPDLLQAYRQLDHPRFIEAENKILEAAKKNNKTVGFLLSNPNDYQKYYDKGIRFFACGTDALFLVTEAKKVVNTLQEFKDQF